MGLVELLESRAGYIGVQAHAALSHSARRDSVARVDTTLSPIKRLDPIPKTPPALPRLGACRDP